MTKAAPIFWKSKQIERVCHSSKDAETLNLSRMLDDATFAGCQLDILLYRDYAQIIKVILFTYLKSKHEYIASSKEIYRKLLQMTVVDLKEKLIQGDVYSYA